MGREVAWRAQESALNAPSVVEKSHDFFTDRLNNIDESIRGLTFQFHVTSML
jgi:hypothetical protein